MEREPLRGSNDSPFKKPLARPADRGELSVSMAVKGGDPSPKIVVRSSDTIDLALELDAVMGGANPL